jgi:hypothetical protein
VISATPEGIRIRVRVQPRAPRNEIVGEHGGALKVRVAAPPVDGAANEALIRFLAERLGVACSAVSVAGGSASRSKTILVTGLTLADALKRLDLPG